MPIDPAVEAPTREVIGHVIRDEIDDVEAKLGKLADTDLLNASLALSAEISGTVVLDICDGQRPSSDDLDEIARSLAEWDERNGLTAQEAQTYLKRVVFGGERLDAVLSTEDALRVPYVVCALLVASSAKTEEGQQWPDYLDAVEAALEQREGI